MALKTSTGLRDKLLVTGSLRTIFAAGFVRIYSGTVPATADDAVTSGNLLCTITINDTGVGVNFETTASGGVLSKLATETWKGTNAATGIATFFRHVTASDTGVTSTTEARMQGLISTAGAELNFSSTGLTANAVQTIDYYSVALPTL